jgi:hypothetical protein
MTPAVTRGLRAAAPAVLLAGLALSPAVAAAACIRGSALALPLVSGESRPGLVLAQRAIERSWGPAEDTSYVEVNVPGWRSEGLAAGLSAAIPGAGQAYVGQRSGLWFGLIELAGWTANRIYVHRAQNDRDRAARFAGNPADSASAWSFTRWSQATSEDPTEIARVWARDPQAFYEQIARDPGYLAGWRGRPEDTRAAFADIRGVMRGNYRRATEAGYALWLNHLVAALDALRAARLHNLPLQRNLELKLKSSWSHGGPEMIAVLMRRF